MRACLRSRSPMLQQALSGGALPRAVGLQFLHTSGSHSLPAVRQEQVSLRHCVVQLQPWKLQDGVALWHAAASKQQRACRNSRSKGGWVLEEMTSAAARRKASGGRAEHCTKAAHGYDLSMYSGTKGYCFYACAQWPPCCTCIGYCSCPHSHAVARLAAHACAELLTPVGALNTAAGARPARPHTRAGLVGRQVIGVQSVALVGHALVNRVVAAAALLLSSRNDSEPKSWAATRQAHGAGETHIHRISDAVWCARCHVRTWVGLVAALHQISTPPAYSFVATT